MVSDETKRYILDYIRNHPVHKCTISDIMKSTGFTRETLSKYMDVLTAEKKVSVVKVANAKAYVLTDKANKTYVMK